ncbi:hypothetical protein EVAR_64966_1 [Eumeta japonica]|uniref:115 kDa protein in type-1 retrotransposable element R1DM n=1 Tax=Eumeta variegata TaxID=151549 RepID=A0A4C1ZMI1_EUMVA|nr:hypothetical protein EVAR_64966_1 [Eumeta japonica]
MRLCPDDDGGRDSNYHKSIRLAATFETSGSDASLTRSELGRIIKALPNTAPGADGLSARIYRMHGMRPRQKLQRYARCVRDGMFPDVWKSGRLIVLKAAAGRFPRLIGRSPCFGPWQNFRKDYTEMLPSNYEGISENQHGFSRGGRR